MRPLALDSLRSVPTTTLAVLAAIFLAAACAGEDLSTDDAPQPISTGGSSVGGQAGASLAGQGGSAAGQAGSSGGSGQSGAPGQGGASGAGMSGSSGHAGEPGAGASGEGAGGAGAGGAAGDAGAAGDTAMAGASSETGGAAGTDAGAAGATDCDPTMTYFADEDGDGHGNPAKSQTGCESPGTWVTSKDDCDDNNPSVFGGQTAFFDVGYPRAGSPGGVSFDYDCNGKEEHDANIKAGVADCSGWQTCSEKSGALPTDRPGSDTIDALCGSTERVNCKVSGLSCNGSKTTTAAVRCH